MSSSIVETTRRLLAPRHELACSWFLWRRLLVGLRDRGEGRHESGAFLLGRRCDDRATIEDFILYDDLDPHCLDSGIIRFDGRYFGVLWDECKRRGLTIVADVHTHPHGPGQSASDRAHPMVTRAGHIAIILPNFASLPVRRREIGIYRYLGQGKWEVVPPDGRQPFLYIGI